jgi:hypothetical protein
MSALDLTSARDMILSKIEEAAKAGNEIVAKRDAATKSGGPTLKTVRNDKPLDEFEDEKVRDAVAKYRKNEEALATKMKEQRDAIFKVLSEAGLVGAESSFDKAAAKNEHAEIRRQYTAFVGMGLQSGAITQADVDSATKLSGWTSGTVSGSGTGTIRPRFESVTVDGNPAANTSTALAAELNKAHKGDKDWTKVDAAGLNALLPENYKSGPSTVKVGPHTVVFTPKAGE